MTSEEDELTKEKARRRTGTQRVGAAEAARLDQRIAEKLQAAAAAASTATTIVGTKGQQELSKFEIEIAIKNASRAAATDADVKPGAVAERSPTAHSQLSALENDVAAKARQMRPGTELMKMEADVVAKALARGSGSTSTQPGARTRLNELEAAVAKNSRQMGGREQLSQLESAVAAKTAAENRNNRTTTRTEIRADSNEKVNNDKEDNHGIDSHMGYDYSPEDTENKLGDLQESNPTQSNMHHAPTCADHGMIREPDVEFGVMQPGGAEGLAVAVAVTEDEKDAFIPSAMEYQPDAKPPIYKNRRFRMYVLGAVVVVITVAVGIAIIVTQTKSKPGNRAPTLAPSSTRETLGIKGQLQLVFGEQKLADTSSAYYKAMDWIIKNDPMQLGPDAENLIQRYLTALLYYSTIEFGPWLSCNPAEKGQDERCDWAKLVGSFPSVYQAVPWIRWLSSHHECKWAGVFCDGNNHITAFETYGQQLSGPLPVDLVHLPFLQSISMEWNNFYGTLPPEWGHMKELINIEVHYNFLTGTIPDSWWRAEKLQRITIGANQITGGIPSDVSGLSLLKAFFTFDNNMNGTLPSELGNIPFLTDTRNSKNFFSGTIPTEIGNLASLREFWVQRTDISGTIPTEFGQLKKLEDLRAYYTGLQGSIPEEAYNMTLVSRIELYNCNFTGTISTLIGNLKALNMLHIRNNKLTGTLPTQLGKLTMLRDVWLEGNNFQGSVPQSLCNLHVPILEADCWQANGVGAPQIYCPQSCCSACCDHVTGVCVSSTQ